MDVLTKSLEFLPTASVALVLGILTYRAQERGRKDTKQLEDKAERFGETQTQMNAWKALYETEHDRRLEAEQDLNVCRKYVRQEFEDAVRTMDMPDAGDKR